MIEPTGRRIITYGSLNQNDPRPLTGDILFEIGSITKVFTSLLLADMVKKGEVALNDPLSNTSRPAPESPSATATPSPSSTSKVFDGQITFKLDSKGSPKEFIWSNTSSRPKRYKRVN